MAKQIWGGGGGGVSSGKKKIDCWSWMLDYSLDNVKFRLNRVTFLEHKQCSY